MVAVISYTPLVRIHLGPLAVSPHGIFIVIGFVIGARLLLNETRERGIRDDVITSVLGRAAIGALLGARFFYVVNHLSAYDSPLEWIKIWEGGISLLGGITGALLAAIPGLRRNHLRFFPMMDMAAPWLALGIGVGRLGDLVIADHLGARTSFALGFRCPEVVDVGRTVGSPCPPGTIVHLTAAYDLLGAVAICGALLWWRRRSPWEGRSTLLLGLFYGTSRFGLDFLRVDTRRLGLTGSQWAALVLVAATSALLALRRPPTRLDPTPIDDPVPAPLAEGTS